MSVLLWIPRLFHLKIALLLIIEFLKSQRQVFERGHICFVWLQIFISIISPCIHGRRFNVSYKNGTLTFVTTHHLWSKQEQNKPRIHEHAKWFANRSQTVREPNARMCGRDCEPALRHPWMIRIPFNANQNLVGFAGTEREWGAPGVLCSPQVCGKLINPASSANCSVRLWFARVYNTLKP